MTKSTSASKTRAAGQQITTTKAAPASRAKPVVTPAARKSPPAVPKPATAPKVVVAKPKHKLVRDSFTIPRSEYAVLEALKLRAAKLERPTKKSEVLRAGVAALNAMSDKAFLAALLAIPSIKTGRPKNPPKSEA
jgi:hypothetical protein